MTDKHAKIDELIEESYLVMLSEEHIRSDLLQFLETCYGCVTESTLEQQRKSLLLSKLDDFRGVALRVDSDQGGLDEDDDQWAALSGRDLLAHRAARVKMMVLTTIRETAPAFADELERKRFPNIRDESEVRTAPRRAEQQGTWQEGGIRAALLQTAYALLAGITVFIVIYRMFFT